MPGTLYLVPTPIGNLEDITLRALAVLKSVDSVVCEDTRQTVKLLNHYGIKKNLLSFYSYNQFKKIPSLLENLRSGKNLALVSDGGTPGISDPGFFLVSRALSDNIPVVSLPGPSAFVTALVASGLSTDGFVFLGFLKRKPGKMKKELLKASELGKTVVFYESVHRIKKTIELLSDIFPDDTRVVIARELTKNFEEYIRGTIEEVKESVKDRELKGEFVVMNSTSEIQDSKLKIKD